MRGKASIGYGQRGFGGLGWGTGNSGLIKSLNFSHFFYFSKKGRIRKRPLFCWICKIKFKKRRKPDTASNSAASLSLFYFTLPLLVCSQPPQPPETLQVLSICSECGQ